MSNKKINRPKVKPLNKCKTDGEKLNYYMSLIRPQMKTLLDEQCSRDFTRFDSIESPKSEYAAEMIAQDLNNLIYSLCAVHSYSKKVWELVCKTSNRIMGENIPYQLDWAEEDE